MKYFIGIDPGGSGGIGIVDARLRWGAFKMPETAADMASMLHKRTLFPDDAHPDSIVLIENVHAMPKQGVSSTFKFGRNFGMCEGVIAASGYRYDFVAPGKWQRKLNCLTKGDKNVTKALAQRLFPEGERLEHCTASRITHATADALLLAYYGRLVYGDGSRDGQAAPDVRSQRVRRRSGEEGLTRA